MKVTFERTALLKALGHVQRMVERRNTIPILSNVLMPGARGQGDLLGHRPRHRSHRHGPGGRRPGRSRVPAHALYEIVSKLPEGAEVALSFAGEAGLSVRAGRSHFNLQGLPAADSPIISPAG